MFFGRSEIVDFGGLGGPGRPGNLPKGGGLRPLLFGGFPGRPGPPRPLKLDDLRAAKKSCVKRDVADGSREEWMGAEDTRQLYTKVSIAAVAARTQSNVEAPKPAQTKEDSSVIRRACK